MRYLLLFCLLVHQLACGSEIMDNPKYLFDDSKRQEQNKAKPTNPIFVSFYRNFEKDCALKNPIKDIPIYFEKQEKPVIGQCITWVTLINTIWSQEIQIDPDFWNSASYWEKKWLVYHELGHCVLFKDHLDTFRENGRPTSMMISYIPYITNILLQEEEKYYINELCEPKKENK